MAKRYGHIGQSAQRQASQRRHRLLRTLPKFLVAGDRKLWKILVPVAVVVVAVSIAGGIYFRSRPAALTEKDTIVLADFVNTTVDPIFDDTLRKALAVELHPNFAMAYTAQSCNEHV